jgi:hypothetical protein
MAKSFYSKETSKKGLRRGFDAGQGREKSGGKKDQGLNSGALDASTPSDHHRNPIFPPRTDFLDWDLGRPIGGSLQERSGNIV